MAADLLQDGGTKEKKHKFDEEMSKKLTYRHLFAVQYRDYIELAKGLCNELGNDKTIALLKKLTQARMLEYNQ